VVVDAAPASAGECDGVASWDDNGRSTVGERVRTDCGGGGARVWGAKTRSACKFDVSGVKVKVLVSHAQSDQLIAAAIGAYI